MKDVHLVLDGRFNKYKLLDFGDFAVKLEIEEENTELFFTCIPIIGQEPYASAKKEEGIGDVFFRSKVEDSIVSIFRSVAAKAELDATHIDELVDLFSKKLGDILQQSERYLPTRHYANLQERTNTFINTLEHDSQRYRNETRMGNDTVERHRKWLEELRVGLSRFSMSLTTNELSALLDTAEAIYPLNFYSGTGYGTCYGTPQLLCIVKNVQSQYGDLSKEKVRISYIVALRNLFEIRSHIKVIPLGSVLVQQSDSEFPYGTINYLNNKLKSMGTPDKKMRIIDEVVTEARKDYVESSKR